MKTKTKNIRNRDSSAFLLAAGYEAVHWSTLGKVDATDSEIMAVAAANDYGILTNWPLFSLRLITKSPVWFRFALKTLTLT